MSVGRIRAHPNVMVLLTVSKELALIKAGNATLTPSVFHRLGGKFRVCILASYKAFFANKASAETLHIKGTIVIVGAEFSGKQSHDIEPKVSALLWKIKLNLGARIGDFIHQL